ncbi:MAG: hypothetical protein WD355_10595 [Balneolaceae bacterium]
MKKLILAVALLAATSSLAFGQTSEPPYGMSHLDAYALFYENYRTGDYEMALTYGEWMLEAKPREIPGHRTYTLQDQFRRFITVYASLAEEVADPAEKRVFLDKAIEIFDLTFETFTDEEIDHFEWIQRQGRFYHDHSRDIEDGMQKAFEFYERAYEMDSQRFTEQNDGYFARILLQNYVSRNENEKALAMIDEVEAYASPALANAINEARNELFSSPEERVVFLEESLEGTEGQEREDLLSELSSLYEEMGDSEKAVETANRLYDLNPNFENTRRLADISLSNAEYRTALEYLEEAMELSPDDRTRQRIAIEISDTYQNLDELQAAHRYARQAMNIDSSWGQPYLKIAEIYAATVRQCTSGRTIDRDDRTVYWLVLDYLDRAKAADSSVTNTANQRAESYRPVMPSTEDKFFREWETGDSFTIDGTVRECYGWINESTTIR